MTDDGIAVLFTAIARYPRRPQWLSQAWEQAQACNEDSNDKIFQIDFPTWFAYQSLKSSVESSVHFVGQSEMRKVLEWLDNQPIHYRRAIAQKVCATIKAEDRSRILSWENRITRKRRCPDSTSPTPRLLRPSAPKHLPSTPHHTEVWTLQNTEVLGSGTLIDPSLSETKKLLPPYLFGAVKKINSGTRETASITMEYPRGNGYEICFSIESNKVENISRELFGALIETTYNGIRYLSCGTFQIIPSDNSTIRGCRVSSIIPFFGDVLGPAICASQPCQRDIKTLSEHTWAVSLTISHKFGDAALLVATVDLHQGTCIAAKLYDSQEG
ncbi:uncharacterized protein F4822DRAFT_432625 [Hypoxylon trugodes]|uniref:uncharacterized protein n=1 Tax=Hypoxylon trugodes TaxID=326681 RepID=UPI0021988CC2|nr:uncharacterized protein F4822DRAFT_432625 [Hypoxylon trugodes]KAI1385772.1 hypothetical protein F4822DRAFT_432625 [Hypoxylon trugodes]